MHQFLLNASTPPQASPKRVVLATQSQYSDTTIEDYNPYDISALNRIADENTIALACEEWRDAHPAFKYIPLEEEFPHIVTMLYPIEANASVREFVEAIAQQSGFSGESEVVG